MKELQELIQIISRQKVDQIELVTNRDNGSTKLQALYNAVLSGDASTDEEAIKLIYDKKSSGAAYNKLKQRLKNRLIDTLFFLDINKYAKSNLEILKYENFKSFSAYKILLDRGKRKLAIKIAENVFREARKQGLTELSLLTAKDLRIHYGIFEMKKSKFNYYQEEITSLKKILDAEIFVDENYILLAQNILKSKSSKRKSFLKKIEPRIKKIMELQNHHTAYSLNLRAFNTIYFFYFLRKEYSRLVEICERALKYFRSKEEYSQFAIFDFKVKLALAKINLKKFEEARVTLHSCLAMNPTKGSVHWYNVQNYLFIISIMLKRYKDAYHILAESMDHPNFKSLFESFKEPWLVKEAYVHFLIHIDKIRFEEDENSELRPFRLGRFLNEVPLHSKDKRGLNITILIIQLLFLIIDKKYSKVIDRIDALKQYSYRYLRNDETFRSNCFIKMLLKIPDADYHPLRLERYTDKLYQKLVATPIEISEQFSEIEIIPYENLWEILMEQLNNK